MTWNVTKMTTVVARGEFPILVVESLAGTESVNQANVRPCGADKVAVNYRANEFIVYDNVFHGHRTHFAVRAVINTMNSGQHIKSWAVRSPGRNAYSNVHWITRFLPPHAEKLLNCWICSQRMSPPSSLFSVIHLMT